MLLTLLMEFFYEHGGKQNKQVRYEKKWTPDYNNLTMRYPIYFYPYFKRMGHTIWVVVMGQSGHISAKLFSLLSPITLPDLLDKQREVFIRLKENKVSSEEIKERSVLACLPLPRGFTLNSPHPFSF